MNTPRQRIMDTATVLFHQQGYNSTGINQIISEANVAKASFYQHFKSKDELCVAFLEARHDYWFAGLLEHMDKGKNTQQKILAAFDFLIHMNKKENFRGCSFLNILSEISGDQAAILAVIQSHKKDLRNLFEKELEDELLSAQVYLLFESSIIESQLFKSNELIKKSKEIITKLI
ncbi:TetR/AcrR family transcriptional regulator [Chitinophaga sp. sic0106]|uniref:TetR/AcrR family transcriptional regulator n=1 Tax=Chitinophaga sp. sic0106 TaxID=2854785 RepID=UPI001C47E4B1|nr:TetR/AcrR family transcriptional regulator [Chitinophaga sp. sic0106]MBV7531043.1 TetR/AcrR family transcriptional regulator [Chitinophaga sp. sic0106]